MTTTRSVLASVAALLLVSVTAAHANVALTQVSSDPFTNSTSTHRTQVEPDTFAFGSTVVSAFQSGRFYNGGSSDIGWATSVDGGATWVHGFLPGITKFQGSGPYDRVSDPSVAYDAAHNVWLVSSLAMLENPSGHGAAVVVSRSVDGGLTWLSPVVTVGAGSDPDKDWTVCDNTAASPFYGHCYTEWDAHANSNRILMSTSSDGGLTWSAAATTADRATGLGGQPVVQPNGTVVVPFDSAYETKVFAFRSTDGGATWSSKVIAAKIVDHSEAGNVRSSPLISAEVDGAGKVYVVWQDCRFQPNCNANDIVMTTSDDGITWSAVARVPIDGINDKVDHFLPGLGVDTSTSGSTARLGLTYHFYPASQCSTSTCQLEVGYIASADGGSHWTAHTQLAGPMSLSWLAPTSQGRMVGDYISTSFTATVARSVFAVAKAPSGSVYDEAMYSPSSSLTAAPSANNFALNPAPDQPVAGATSDHPLAQAPLTHR